jgi:hypothetical protein
MFKISSATELLHAFPLSAREKIELPSDLVFPIYVKDYLSWVEPSGAHAYFVVDVGTRRAPFGVAFRRNSGGAISMCEWCHSVSQEVGLLSTSASSRRSVGIHLCGDLNCRERMAGGPGVHDFPRTTSEHQRLIQMLMRARQFIQRSLI